MHESQDARRLLGGYSPARFLARHWQKQPLLIRDAVPGFRGLITRAQLIELACREDVRSRVVIRQPRQWQVHHGPFRRTFFRSLPVRGWSLLVHDVNHVLPQARALLDRFDFIPFARQDDVMVSFAPPGAGVGPHFDSYDVFLLQGPGRRRWQISHQSDFALVERAPLKLLRRFRAEQEYVLASGDMLYLPPGWAHNGVALDACMTYSIGFRAPAWQDLAIHFLRHLEDHAALDGMYQDPQLKSTRRPGQIAPTMITDTAAELERLRWRTGEVTRFLGQHLTEPRAHVVFTPPARALSKVAFATRARRSGVSLDLKTQMLYAGSIFFVNGEAAQVTGRARVTLMQLADCRSLASVDISQRGLNALLHEWYRAGYLQLGALNRGGPV